MVDPHKHELTAVRVAAPVVTRQLLHSCGDTADVANTPTPTHVALFHDTNLITLPPSTHLSLRIQLRLLEQQLHSVYCQLLLLSLGTCVLYTHMV